jgi:radical SAM family uncharacterized protein
VTDTGLWPRIEPLLAGVERPSRYIDREWGARHDADATYRACLIYPDAYEIGQSNAAIAILYDQLNALEGVAAERAYLPWLDMSAAMRKADIPLFALESCTPVRDFDVVGVTIPYELTYANILEALDLAGIPLRSADRTTDHPLVIAGGPGTYNPEPIAEFFDAVFIGEGEGALAEIVSAHRKAAAAGLGREETLMALARVGGVYVPSLYTVTHDSRGALVSVRPREGSGAPRHVAKRVVASLDAVASPVCGVVPFIDVVHDRYGIEVARGCSRGCRFCQAGMVYRPVRERSADTIVRDVMRGLSCTGYDEVSLTSLSTTDHSQLEEVLRRLRRRLADKGVSISLPSLRVDAFGVRMAQLVSAGKKGGLTLAPEAGTQRLRDVVNKNVSEENLLDSVRNAVEGGWRRVKLYFMIGLPSETDDDIRGIGVLVNKVLSASREAAGPGKGAIRVAVSVSTFVPKAHTPFQWEAQITAEEIVRRQRVLRESMPRKGVDLHWHDAEVSFLEGVMARGGREISAAIEEAWKSGAVFDAWTEQFDLSRWMRAFEVCGIDASAVASRARTIDEVLPWEHISTGVSRTFLEMERVRAMRGESTQDCSFEGCVACGVCASLNVDVDVAGGKRG